MKKLFIISLALFGFTLILLGVYNFAFKKPTMIKTPTASQSNQQAAATNIPNKPASAAASSDQPDTAKKKVVQAITSDPVVGPAINKKDEKIIYYSANDGTVWQVDQDGLTKKQLVDTKLNGLKNVLWSPDRSKVLTQFIKDSKTSYFMYDYAKNAGVALKDGLDTAIWDNIGATILYKYFDTKTNKRSLNISNPDGSNWKVLVPDIPFRYLSIAQIPGAGVVSFWNSANSKEQSQLQTVNITGGGVKTIFTGKYGADYLWAPNGSTALLSSLVDADSSKITLGTIDSNGTYKDLKIATLASKCVWTGDSKTIYCGVPDMLPSGSVLPDDYMSKKITTRDSLWKIDAATGIASKMYGQNELQGAYDFTNVFLSATEDSVLFVNRADGKLYAIDLNQ